MNALRIYIFALFNKTKLGLPYLESKQLAENTSGDHRRKIVRLATRILEAVGLAGVHLNFGSILLKPIGAYKCPKFSCI
ncbi:hypothetical protein BHM03_00015202 [Ensete ventricosum]|nr:hypothetical protein BHM03_00015202 [Ensete ventricosum]